MTGRVPYDVADVRPPSLKPPRAYPASERDAGAPELLDHEQIYGLAGEVVRELLPWTEADPAALLFDFLTAFGSAVGPGAHVWVSSSRHEPKLFAVTVGDTSGGRKGTARDNVRQLFELAAPEWSRENVQAGLSSGEGLIQAMADMDGTKNLLAVETEFGRVLAVAGRAGNTVSDYIRQLWEGDRVRVLNRKRLVLDGAYFSLLGHITATELRMKMAEVDLANGFANRILWVFASRSKLIPEGRRIPDVVLAPLAKRVADAIRAARLLSEVARTPRANHYWVKAYRDMAAMRLPGLLGAVTDRREAQALRLSLIFAAIDGSRAIRPEHVEAALSAWRCCEHSAAFVFGASTGDRRADKALAALRRSETGSLERSTIASRVFGNNLTSAQLTAIRNVLVEGGFINVGKAKTGGRDAELWTFL